MKTLTRCCVRAAVLAVVFTAPSTAPATAQGDISLTGGSGVYASDAFCLDTEAFFSVFELSGGGDLVGGSVAYSNGSWPWIDPPDAALLSAAHSDIASLSRAARASTSAAPSIRAQTETFLTTGSAIRIMAEAFPLAVLSRLAGRVDGALSDINRYVRPFFGAGLHISGDGEAAPIGTAGRELPTFGLQGSTDFMVSYGARAYLPNRDFPVRVVLLYRGITMFKSEVVYLRPEQDPLRGDGETLTWGEWGVGFSLRVGG